MNKSNVFEQIPNPLNEELFEELVCKEGVKIERIVSYGHVTSEFEWYEQKTDEWVILLKGKAVLSFENEEDLTLEAGDYLNIPAMQKHRVSWTIPDQESVWLAVHY